MSIKHHGQAGEVYQRVEYSTVSPTREGIVKKCRPGEIGGGTTGGDEDMAFGQGNS